MRWIKTRFPGIRFREHPTRKHGVKPDRYFCLHFKVDGKVVDEPVGWASEGVTAEIAASRLADLRRNKRKGTGPTTQRELRSDNKAKQEAEEATRKAELEAQRTLAEYWDESYFPAAQRSKKASSWKREEQHFRLWIGPLLGGLQLRSIALPQWDELVKTLTTANLTPRTKEYVTGTLRRIMRHAYDRRMVNDSPPTGKRVGISGPGNNRRLRSISREEESAIMEHLLVVDMHAWRIARFAFLTGCRASEAFNLKWATVDLSGGRITFPETKNHDSRTIPITPPLADLFGSMQLGTPDSHVFTKRNGEPYLQAPSAFQTTVDNLGLNENRTRRDRIVFHSIRHSVATRLAQRLGPRDLMGVMGWRTVQMAMRYVHENESAKLAALSMLGVPAETGTVLPFRTTTRAL